MSDRANFYSVSEGHEDLSPQQKFGKLDNLNPLFPENVTFTSPKTLNDFFFFFGMFDRADFYSISEGHKVQRPQQKLD